MTKSPDQIIGIAKFLDGFQIFKLQIESRMVENFINEFSQLKVEFAEISDKARQEALVEAPSFNVFKVLACTSP